MALVRLNRFIASSGVTSRRKADELIKEGRVRVNGEVVRELGVKIDPEKDRVEVDGQPIKEENKVYIALNKPKGYLTTLGKDHRGRRTVKELIEDMDVRVYPVGRLDYDTEGLLLFTNDGELSFRLLHPRYRVEKVYLALLKGDVDERLIRRMRKGIELRDGFLKPDGLKLIKRGDESLVEITIHEGRKRIVRRFFKQFNRPVINLKRVRIGPITLGKLESGRYRFLSSEEVYALKKVVGLI